MAFQFRVATIDDIPEISRLIAASVRNLHPEYTPAEREAAIATVFTVDSRLVGDGTYFVAYADDGRLAGCGGWSKRKTLYGGDHQIGAAETELIDPAVDAAKIRAIFVHPDFARQGLGSALLHLAEDAAAQAGYQSFEMGSTLAGLELYRQKGYQQLKSIDVPVSQRDSIKVVWMRKQRRAADV